MALFDNHLVIAISSRALFDLEESHDVFQSKGLIDYSQYQIDHEEKPLNPGYAFPFVQKLLSFNKILQRNKVEVVLLSRNSADTGLRVFNSIRHHKLDITRAVFSGGKSPYGYATALDCHLFLSINPEDVRKALEHGVAAATLFCGATPPIQKNQLRIAFDGDAVLFSDEAERTYQQVGLQKFQETEAAKAKTPLEDGPLRPFLTALQKIQQEFVERDETPLPIRTALVTARGAPADERVIRTLRHWKVHLDESMFLNGLEKTAFLKAFGADIFFDDQMDHCRPASEHFTTGHIPDGVINDQDQDQDQDQVKKRK